MGDAAVLVVDINIPKAAERPGPRWALPPRRAGIYPTVSARGNLELCTRTTHVVTTRRPADLNHAFPTNLV